MDNYRKRTVTLLCLLADRANFLCGEDENLEYDFDGKLPATPEDYIKESWEHENYSIEELVYNYLITELDRAIIDYDNHIPLGGHKADQLLIIKNLILRIEWSEI